MRDIKKLTIEELKELVQNQQTHIEILEEAIEGIYSKISDCISNHYNFDMLHTSPLIDILNIKENRLRTCLSRLYFSE